LLLLRCSILLLLLLVWPSVPTSIPLLSSIRSRSRISTRHLLLSPQHKFHHNPRLQPIILLKRHTPDPTPPVKDLQPNPSRTLISHTQLDHRHDTLDDLPPDNRLLAEPRTQQEHVDAHAAGDKRLLDPGDEFAFEAIEHDDLDVWDGAGCSAGEGEVVVFTVSRRRGRGSVSASTLSCAAEGRGALAVALVEAVAVSALRRGGRSLSVSTCPSSTLVSAVRYITVCACCWLASSCVVRRS